ncbi:cytochrome c family protein [Ehrlichia chaffeensis str. Heartland]|uniref:Cytochrome c homolog n=1 Tax=Ehrlichia chaffeensis (strain ATCC CRL-10679 / Arkansas) TaxID=205920 RepID=Q2GHD6_EHRCR|nr:cytochrome c family protein [Ehrlichia chaffeensis]ABD44791.1 cytochrome C, membrane-bound [Ehrlichia chaffeensis str. Arkansas]AHX03440.1 cytochrome c family protein [Ehrlichia chaffeensis str. Heartland]AHX05839.1 cytochrome c family protein [Ehrlichia chaffeensis str. Jax]AHX06831.1 cytochrome c family protein [Ehrlichia chaffeensis str. Liberty]AHX07507.1 cytochrome c family protein [Ehrlichia chaffeensis str. Osceola]
MDGFHLNKIFTAILFASFIVLFISNVVNLLYDPDPHAEQTKGYKINIEEHIPTEVNNTEEQIDIESLIAQANIAKGKDLTKKCISCHTFEKGGANRVGPNLWHIVGNKKAHLGDSFNYSKAMLSKGGTWEYQDLFQFLTKPQAYIKGTRMAFAGISKPQDVADLIAYLKSLE